MGGGILAVVMLLLSCARRRAGTVYTVGDSSGWAVGVDYNSWVAGKSFVVGDSLVFKSPAGTQTVAEVTSDDYASCTGGGKADSSGTTNILLGTTGTHYFICTDPGHCSGGMKLAVPVQATSSSGAMPSGPKTTTFATPTTVTTPYSFSSRGGAPLLGLLLAGMVTWCLL